MNKALGEILVMVKLRTGVKERNTVHKLMPWLSSKWGVGCITASLRRLVLFALTRRVCAAARTHATATLPKARRLGLYQGVRGRRTGARGRPRSYVPFPFPLFPLLIASAVLAVSPIPIFGGGDCFSQDYWEKVDTSGMHGIMIGRGALTKPWIFTEIKERVEGTLALGNDSSSFARYVASLGHTTPGL
jgi:tRNA-dihydrouridine synthase 3